MKKKKMVCFFIGDDKSEVTDDMSITELTISDNSSSTCSIWMNYRETQSHITASIRLTPHSNGIR